MSENAKGTVRKDWVDALRAIALLFVLYGHMVPELNNYFVFTSPVKIPLFFVITGYVFNRNRTEIKPFLINLFRKLIVPWIVLSLIPIIIQVPLKGIDFFTSYFCDLIAGRKIWYLPCCIIAEIIHFIIIKLIKRKELIVIASVICTAAGLFLSNRNIADYAMINRAFTVQGFIIIGYLIKQFETRLFSISNSLLVLLWIVYLAMCAGCLFLYPGQSMDVHTNSYYNVIYCFAQVIAGSLSLFITAERISKFPRVLLFIGKNTLLFYIWSGTVQSLLFKAASMLGITVKNNAVLSLAAMIPLCVCLGICAWLINKYLPVIVGKKPNK